ncbi:MAG: tRNA lysidine(34) synthetase TilS [Pseudomonadota bacterium]
MASSRKRLPKADPLEHELLDALRAALAARPAEAALRRDQGAARRDGPLLVAYSGGRDSTVLLDLARRLRDARTPGWRKLFAVHVHHGLLPQADDWAAHCERVCSEWRIPCDVRRANVARGSRGIEAAARDARYAALAAAAREHGARLVLTAHHLDDRIETFLLQWLRGAGVDGLAAMPPSRAFGAGLTLLRPLLDVSREQIDRYARARGLPFVEDPSNADTRLARNALRARVLPELEAIRGGFRRAAARSIELVADAADVLRDLASADLAACADGAPSGMLRLDRLAALAPARRALVVREWLAVAGLEAPSRARLGEIVDQALNARGDARLLVRIADREVRRHRGLLLLRPAAAPLRRHVPIRWQGEREIVVPEWGGVLRFEPTGEQGFDADWLRAAALEVRGRGGGERFKPHPTRPSKTLKRLFQEAGVAEFERASLPLVWRGDDLIYVAGLGPDARMIDTGGERVRLDWRPDATLLGD